MLINIFVMALSGFFLLQSRQQFINRVEIQTQNLVTALELTLSGMFNKTNLALLSIIDEAEKQLKHGTIDWKALSEFEAHQHARIPEVTNFQIIQTNGDMIAYENGRQKILTNIADRDHFLKLKQDTKAGLIFSKPIFGRVNKKWILIAGRRINNPDGSFAGVIQATISIDSLVHMFSAFDLGRYGVFTLRDADLDVVARHPIAHGSNSTIGSKSVSKELRTLVQKGEEVGTYVSPGSIDSLSRIFSYRKLSGYPFYVNAGRSARDYLDDWYDEVWKTSALCLLFAMGTIFSARLMFLKWKEAHLFEIALQHDNEKLENLILERTAELNAANEQLRTELVERGRVEEERLTLEKQFLHTQKLESLGVLAGGIAHDFNNILTSIIGNAELALIRINHESPAVENLRKIELASARAADLAKQMLAYSGKGRFVIENIDLNRLLEEMLHMVEVSISKKAALRLNLTRPLATVEADATQMHQVVMNLIINASEALGEENGTITITTDCMDCDRGYLDSIWPAENLPEGPYVVLDVADTGCGMDAETLTKIFDPFFTTKFTGRGLGMAAVFGIIKGHKGTIKIYSEPGKGSIFKVLLPADASYANTHINTIQSDGWKGNGTILLVDDEEIVRTIGSEMLQELGFDVIVANDGQEALDIFSRRNDIHAVILDLTMPRLDGEQAFNGLRIIRPDVKVIISSGYNEQDVTRKFDGKGLAGFVQKPYRLSVLRDTLRKIAP
jgi:signal transduction histidine kinase/CheY-like chemotaxis protein